MINCDVYLYWNSVLFLFLGTVDEHFAKALGSRTWQQIQVTKDDQTTRAPAAMLTVSTKLFVFSSDLMRWRHATGRRHIYHSFVDLITFTYFRSPRFDLGSTGAVFLGSVVLASGHLLLLYFSLVGHPIDEPENTVSVHLNAQLKCTCTCTIVCVRFAKNI